MPTRRRRRRREQLEAMLAGGQARLERARSRSLVVDTMVGVVQRERPVAVGILAASLAFRLFALAVPLAYVAVAGLGFAGQAAVDVGRPEAGTASATCLSPRWLPPPAARTGPAGWP
jgi:hypothetical protein